MFSSRSACATINTRPALDIPTRMIRLSQVDYERHAAPTLKDGGFAWAAFAGEGVGGAAGWNCDALSSGRRVNRPGKRAVAGRSGERAELAGG